MAARSSTSDLTRVGLPAINGQPVIDVAQATLSSGQRMVRTWDTLEPVVQGLVTKVQAFAEDDEVEGITAAKLLELCASVIHKIGAASTGLLRASEGLSKLALLIDAGQVKRTQPTAMTEKQLAQTVIETVRRIAKDSGSCPICTTTVEV